VHEVSRAVVAGVGAVLAVLIATFLWVLVLRSEPVGDLRSDGVPVVDVQVDRVVATTADGRDALASVTLRMRDEDTPAPLRTVAARTPTPVPGEYMVPGKRLPNTPAPTSADALMRDRVAAAVGRLTYAQTAGEQGKTLLRETIRDAANQVLPEQPVVEVFVREYLVK
jgi:hypothetical protein